MVRLRHLRTSKGWTLKQMSSAVGVSIATLSRIEAAERMGQKQHLEERVVTPLISHVNEVFKQSYNLEDFDGITIAPPRSGRPKKNVEDKAGPGC